MWEYSNTDELAHYGVLGMKWGIRRARRKDAKNRYKKATDIAFRDYEKAINKIEKPYKMGQNLSDKDYAREAAAEKRYQSAVSKAKNEYKRAKNDKSKDAAIADRLYSKQSSEANKRVANMSMGKALTQTYLMGSFGALRYNEAKARGASTGRAAVEGILYNMADVAIGNYISTAQYLDNRFARKNK